jgi:hypothetical protein
MASLYEILENANEGEAIAILGRELGLTNRLGMKPESFSRALAKLKPYGVTVDRETVLVADPAKLQSFAIYAEDDDRD